MLSALALSDKDLGQPEAAVDELFGIAVIDKGHPFLAEFVGKKRPGLVGEFARVEGRAIHPGWRRALEAVRPVGALAAVTIAFTVTLLLPRVALMGVSLALRLGLTAVTVSVAIAIRRVAPRRLRTLALG